MISATEPAVSYTSCRLLFSLNARVSPTRKLLELMGREIPSHFTLSTTVTLKQLAKANEKVKMNDAILQFTRTSPTAVAEIYTFHITCKISGTFSVTDAIQVN
jgi:hypothetical protein